MADSTPASYLKVSVKASGGSSKILHCGDATFSNHGSTTHIIKQETQTFKETSLLPVLKQMVEFCVNHEKEGTGTLNKIKILCTEIWGFESCCNRITRCCNSLIQKISSMRETIIRLCQTLTDANLTSLPSTEEFTSKPVNLLESELDRDEVSSNVGNLSITPSNQVRKPPLVLGQKFIPEGGIHPVTLVTASVTPEVPDRNVLFNKAKQNRKGQQLLIKRRLVKEDLSNSVHDESGNNEEVLNVSGQTLCLETNSNAVNQTGPKSSSSSTGNETLELISDQSFLKNNIKSPELISNKLLSKNNIENEIMKKDHSLLNNFRNKNLATISDQSGLKINGSKISAPSQDQSFMKNNESTTPTPLSDESFLKMGFKKEPDLSSTKDGAYNIKSSTISLDVPTKKNPLLATTEKMKGKSHDLQNTKSWTNHKLKSMGYSVEKSGCHGKRADEANIIDYACIMSKDQSMHKMCKVANKLTYDKLLSKIQLELCNLNSEETVKELHDSSYNVSFPEKSCELKNNEYEETKIRSHDYQKSVEFSNDIINGRRSSLKKQSKDGEKRSAEFIMKPFEINQNQPNDLGTYQSEKTPNLSHELTDSFLENSRNQSNDVKNDQSEEGEKSHDMTVNQSEERENANNVTNDKLEKREKSHMMTFDQSEDRERLEERESKKYQSYINDQSEGRERSRFISNDQSKEKRKAHDITNNQLKGSDNTSPDIKDPDNSIISMDFADDDDDDDVDREEQMEYVINDTNPSVRADHDNSVRAYRFEMGEEQMKVGGRESTCNFSSLPDLVSFLEEEIGKEVGYIEEARDRQTSIEGEREGQVEVEVVPIDSGISRKHRPSSRPKSDDQGSKKFLCESCAESFQSYHLLCEHITASHPGKKLAEKFVCTICSEVFKTNYFVCKHYKLSHADITFTCQLCTESFMRNRLLVKHQQVCHPEFNFKTKVFTCRICSQNFQSVDLYQTHVKIHGNDPLFKCTFCDKVFQKKMYMKIHRTKYHGEEMKDYNSGLEYENEKKKSRKYRKHKEEDLTCKICNKIFPCISLLEKHRYTHTDERTVKCETCGKMFKHGHGLKSHQETHRQTKDFACKLCSFTTNTRRNLNSHMFSHKTEKNVICDVCGARFVNSGCLLKHKITHSNVKPFACDVCGKTFSLNSKMMFHRRIHTDVGRYVCDVCGKRTHQHHNLVVHMRTHTGKKPFECKTCGKTFAHNVSLRSHRNSCIPVRNFSAATTDNLVVEKKASNVSIEIESDANSPNTALNCIKSDEIGNSRRKSPP